VRWCQGSLPLPDVQRCDRLPLASPTGPSGYGRIPALRSLVQTTAPRTRRLALSPNTGRRGLSIRGNPLYVCSIILFLYRPVAPTRLVLHSRSHVMQVCFHCSEKLLPADDAVLKSGTYRID
jgi:hypothetical protein